MDLFSNLPDEIVCHILSFLTTKETALTSVLSKRWRYLIAFVPNLHIDNSVFLNPEEGKHKSQEIQQSFMDFVDRVLSLQRNSPIKKASLKCLSMRDSDSNRVDDWISNLLARGVCELDLLIYLCMDEYVLLSSKCFESRNLVKLKLDSLCIGVQPDMICCSAPVVGWLAEGIVLPMLKTLVIKSVGFYVDEFFLRALPALEELVLDDVFWLWNVMDVTVSNANLKTLTVNSNHYTGTISFDTPSLVYFCCSDYVAKDYPVVNMENLVEARISLLVTEDQIKRARAPNDYLLDEGDDNVVLRFENVGKLMNGIRNVQYLDLSAVTLEVLSFCCDSMPVFNNLKSLTIKSDENHTWQAMPVLIRNCPHLETLVLEGLSHHVADNCGDACDCVSRKGKGRSLTSCPVKVLEIKGFQGTEKEMDMVKHLLNYFLCLMEIKIYMNVDIKGRDLEAIVENMKHYNKNCNVQFLVNGDLYKEWRAQ
ncbi:PREDICTED: F-box/LRR-repeat protein At5g38396-like [Camelina sativa]|uniref:F-box/LRR-repeat protein At5g38396-like n=1 Tax=Camelina sativa TaxID=90675 RepID=A0ABM0U4M2_CAMSA|nr:PREDICTED: F-box/LRR-repeat protein At5g38396-like [Camelina sativa]